MSCSIALSSFLPCSQNLNNTSGYPPNNLDDSVRDFIVAISINALDPDPVYERIVVDPAAHVGSVRTSGTDGDQPPATNRDLGDYISIDIDEYGRTIVAFGHDGDDGPNNRQIPCLFGRQNEGAFLLEDVGPNASFKYSISDLKVKVDASLSSDLNGKGIVNYTWDGGTTPPRRALRHHKYRNSEHYNIAFTVVNQDGQIMKKSVRVSADKGGWLPFAGARRRR